MSIKIKDGREELWQWDTERFLTVSDDVDFVHFSNLQYGQAFTSEVVYGEARIPDELLQVNGQLYSYIFKGSVENGYTEYSERFEIKKKPKPVDYVFTPTEYITIESLDKRVEKLEKQGGGGGSVFSPTVEIQSIDGGHKVIITDINGNHEFDVLDGKKGDKGEPGNDYVLTESDKQEIAEMIPIPESGTNDYTKLENKPKINGVELDGDKTLEALGIPTGDGSEKPWQKIGTFTANDNINPWIIETDENGKPFACTEFRIRLQICLFKDTDVSSMNHGIKIYGDDKKWYEVFLGAVENGVIPIVSGAEVVSVSATFKNPAVMDITTHCGLIVIEIATEGTNNPGHVILKGVCRNRGLQHSANHFTKIQYYLGHAENLVMKDSTIEIWGR